MYAYYLTDESPFMKTRNGQEPKLRIRQPQIGKPVGVESRKTKGHKYDARSEISKVIPGNTLELRRDSADNVWNA